MTAAIIEVSAPPSADDAELGLMAECVLEQRSFRAVCELVRAEHFRSRAFASTYRVLAAVHAKGEPWAPELMAQEARHLSIEADVASALSDQPDALSALRGLADLGSGGQAEHYAPLVVDAALRRIAFYRAGVIREQARAGSCPVINLAEDSRGLAQDLEAGFAVEATGHTADLVQEAYDDLANPKGEAKGALLWGLPSLDRTGARIARGSYPVLAAMTNAGKSTLALQAAYGIAERTGRPVLFASLEMQPAEMVRRAIISRSGVPAPTDRGPTTEEKEAWAVARDEVRAVPVYIPPIGERDIGAFLRWLSAVTRKRDFAAVFVDHIGLLRTKARDLYTGTTEVSQRLREWTLRGAEIPIVAVAQLRRVERKQDGASRPPELFDLKDSGSIENDATAVLMIDRPWVRASTEDRAQGRVSETAAALYLKKNRNGATHRKVPLYFDGPRFRITEQEHEHRAWAPRGQ